MRQEALRPPTKVRYGIWTPAPGPTKRHLARIRSTVFRLSELADHTYPPALPELPNPYWLLRKWAHMLGFRGHFASKSRRYSTTLGQLRSARRRFERAKAFSPDGVVDLAALDQELVGDDTTLVINDWRFARTGSITAGDAVLAAEASAKTRENYATKGAHGKPSRPLKGSPSGATTCIV